MTLFRTVLAESEKNMRFSSSSLIWPFCARKALASPADQLVVAQQEKGGPVAEAVDALDDAADQQQLVGGRGDLLHVFVQGRDVGGAVAVFVPAGELPGHGELGQFVQVLELFYVPEHVALEGIDAVQQQLRSFR